MEADQHRMEREQLSQDDLASVIDEQFSMPNHRQSSHIIITRGRDEALGNRMSQLAPHFEVNISKLDGDDQKNMLEPLLAYIYHILKMSFQRYRTYGAMSI